MKSLAVILFLVAGVIGCSRNEFPEPQFSNALDKLKTVDTASLVATSQALITGDPSEHSLPTEKWPTSIRLLQPHLVYIYSDSVLIILEKMGGKESGFMIRKNGSLPEKASSLTGLYYRKIDHDLYWYAL